MSPPSLANKLGVTPGRLALVGVLSAVLIVVLIGQFSGGSTEAIAAVRPERKPAARAQVATPTENKTQVPTATQQFPDVPWQLAAKHDPFAGPHWFVAAATPVETETDEATPNEALVEMQEQGTRIVVISPAQKLASIGDRHVRVGDTVNGFRITDITTEGVVLVEDDQQ